MLGMVGLAFAACSNEEEVGNNLSGNGVVEVKIVAPSTKSLVDGTTGNNEDKVQVTGEITVELTAGTGSQSTTIIADGKTHTVKFYGVKAPSLIEAYINDGKIKLKVQQILPTYKCYQLISLLMVLPVILI